MSEVSDSVKAGYIVLAPLSFVGFAVVQYFQGSLWGAGIMVSAAILTLPNVHRFYNEIRMGQKIEDERFNRVIRKSGFTAFFATLVTAILVGGAARIGRIGAETGFLAYYGNQITLMAGALVFAVAQVWYKHVGTQRNIKQILLGDEV